MRLYTTLLLAVVTLFTGAPLLAAPLVYQGEEGIGKGKHIVFIANDHEYRSEETCPLLAKLFAKHHGFKCTVLFGINEDGHIQPGDAGIPGLEALEDADLLVFFTRFMNLPDEQVDQLVSYFERGGPVVGMRTSTHCFNKQAGKWARLNFNYKGDDYHGGLGKQIFGNTWDKVAGQSHYGSNHQEGGTLTAEDGAENHPILTGVNPIHCYSGAYKSQPPADAIPLLTVQVLNTFEPSDDINKSKPPVNAGWAMERYTAPSGDTKEARVVYTSIGSSEDLIDEDARRFFLNASLWAAGMEDKITADLDVSIVGKFLPSPYTTGAFYRLGVKPEDLAEWDSSVLPEDAELAGVSATPNPRIGRALSVRPKLLEQLKSDFPGFELKSPAKKKKKEKK